MRNDQKRRRGYGLRALLVSLAAVLLMCGLCLGVAAAGEVATDGGEATEVSADTAALSPALQVLAARTDMAVATLCGNEYYFSGDVFARSLNMATETLRYITVTSLPGTAEGELMMGSTCVSVGQVISAGNLPMLSYVAADESIPSQGSFTFSVNEGGYEMSCHVYVLAQLNQSPTLRVATEAALRVSTHRDFAAYGNLAAYDPEGDELVFEIVRAPRHGLVIMTDAACGEYVYLPRIGFRGGDSFEYVARDRYGNYSASAEVTVQVSEPSVSVSLADMDGRRDYNAALTMIETGIMQGETVESGTYFYPERTVSRLDFLVMAMRAIGVGSVPSVSDTGFSDDADIPAEQKGYVAAAYSLGYIKGSSSDQGELCFLPGETITRAEAAVILRRMVEADTPELTPVFADSSDIPAWASEAISTLTSVGVMTTSGGAISPGAAVTRGQTAMMLAALSHLVEKD